jgi:hypothetical protein
LPKCFVTQSDKISKCKPKVFSSVVTPRSRWNCTASILCKRAHGCGAQSWIPWPKRLEVGQTQESNFLNCSF